MQDLAPESPDAVDVEVRHNASWRPSANFLAMGSPERDQPDGHGCEGPEGDHSLSPTAGPSEKRGADEEKEPDDDPQRQFHDGTAYAVDRILGCETVPRTYVRG